MPRPPAKRAAAMAFMNSIGNAASIWTPFTYFDSSVPYYRPALGIVIGLMVVGGITGTILRFYLSAQNKYVYDIDLISVLLAYQTRHFERMETSDQELRADDLKKLEKTAEMEGTDVAHARQLQVTDPQSPFPLRLVLTNGFPSNRKAFGMLFKLSMQIISRRAEVFLRTQRRWATCPQTMRLSD